MCHGNVRGAKLLFIASQLSGHGIKVSRKADHFCGRFFHQLCLSAKLPIGHIFGRITNS